MDNIAKINNEVNKAFITKEINCKLPITFSEFKHKLMEEFVEANLDKFIEYVNIKRV